jgi:hypothetical protein
MTRSSKLELLGQVSERARELEDPTRALIHVESEVVERMSLVREARVLRQWRQVQWSAMREQLVELMATALNWVLAGDRTLGQPSQNADVVAPVAPTLDRLRDSGVLADALGYLYTRAPARRGELTALCLEFGLTMVVE